MRTPPQLRLLLVTAYYGELFPTMRPPSEAASLFFVRCVDPHQQRQHFPWQILRNFIAAPQRLTYRGAHGGSRRCFRVGQPISLIA
jgi:hypothetical protein